VGYLHYKCQLAAVLSSIQIIVIHEYTRVAASVDQASSKRDRYTGRGSLTNPACIPLLTWGQRKVDPASASKPERQVGVCPRNTCIPLLTWGQRKVDPASASKPERQTWQALVGKSNHVG